MNTPYNKSTAALLSGCFHSFTFINRRSKIPHSSPCALFHPCEMMYNRLGSNPFCLIFDLCHLNANRRETLAPLFLDSFYRSQIAEVSAFSSDQELDRKHPDDFLFFFLPLEKFFFREDVRPSPSLPLSPTPRRGGCSILRRLTPQALPSLRLSFLPRWLKRSSLFCLSFLRI